ncbi:MAG: hypothetical protein ACO20G_08415, partial [Ilumatobacteraceae bacterium]
CEQRQFLAAHENIDRIDLDDTHLPHNGAQMTPVDARWHRRCRHWARSCVFCGERLLTPTETLGRKGHTAGLVNAKSALGNHDREYRAPVVGAQDRHARCSAPS